MGVDRVPSVGSTGGRSVFHRLIEERTVAWSICAFLRASASAAVEGTLRD
jgi:hypothetical protein